MDERHTTVDVLPLGIEGNAEAALQLLLDTLLRDGHEVGRPQDLADLGQEGVVAGQAHHVLGGEELGAAKLAVAVAAGVRGCERHARVVALLVAHAGGPRGCVAAGNGAGTAVVAVLGDGDLALGGVAVARDLGAGVLADRLGVPEFGLVLLPLLLGDDRGVELALVGNDNLLARLAGNDTRVTPVEVVHVPEGVQRQGETEDGNGQDVQNHPANHLPLAANDKDDGLQTVNGTKHDESRDRHHAGVQGDGDNQVDDVGDNDGLDDGGQQVDEDNKTHGETAETAELGHGDELHEVVDGRVDPATSLREEDGPGIGRNGVGVGAVGILCLVRVVELEQQRRQVSILTEVEQVLHVQRVDTDGRVGLDDFATDKQGLAALGGADAVHGETAGQTGDTAKQTLKGLCQVVGNPVLVDLDHGDERGLCVGQRRLTAHGNEAGVVEEGGDHAGGGIGCDDGIGIDLEHELVERWVDTDDVADLMVHFELERTHGQVVVDAVEETHNDHLRITLATVTGAGHLGRLANLDDNHERDNVTLDFVQTRVDLAHVVLLLTFTERLEAEGFGVDGIGNTQNVEHDARRRLVVALTDNHTVADNDEELALIVVMHAGDGINGTAKSLLVFGVGGNLAHDKLVEVLRHVLATELERGQELETKNGAEDDGDGEDEVLSKLTADRVTRVNVADVEQVVETRLHALLGGGIERQLLPEVREIGSRLALEQLHDGVVHEAGEGGIIGNGLARLGLHLETTVHVLGEIVHAAAHVGNVLLLVGEGLDVLGRVADGALLVVGLEHDHLLIVPIRTAVVGEVAEVVILEVEVGRRELRGAREVGVAVVQRDVGVDGAVLALAQSVDLDGEQSADILAGVVLELLVGNVRRVVAGGVGTQVDDHAADGDVGRVVVLAVIGGQFLGAVDVLGGADELGEYDNEEGGKETEEPDEHVDGELFSPCHANVLAGHAAHLADGNVRHEPGHEVDHKHPPLTAGAVLELFNLLEVLLVAALGHLLAGVEVLEHVTTAKRGDAGFRPRIGAVLAAKVAALALFAVQQRRATGREQALLGSGKRGVLGSQAVAVVGWQGVAAGGRGAVRQLGDLHPTSLAKEDTGRSDTDLVGGPVPVFDHEFDTLPLGADKDGVRVGKTEELTKGEEQTKVCRTQALANLGNTKCLHLGADTLAIKLVGNASVVGLQAEDKVRVAAGVGNGLGDVVQGRKELTRGALLRRLQLVAARLRVALAESVQLVLGSLVLLLLVLLDAALVASGPGGLAGHDTGRPRRLGADGGLHDRRPLLGVGDGLEGLLAKEAGDKLALGRVDHVEQITGNDLAVLLNNVLDGVVDLAGKVLNGKEGIRVLGVKVAAGQSGVGRAGGDGRVLALEALAQTLEELHVGTVSACLVVEDAEQAVSRLEQTPDGVRVVKVARGRHADLLVLQHVCLAVEEVLQGEVVEGLAGGVVEQLVERRVGGRLLGKAGEVNNGNGVGDAVLGCAESLVDGLDNVGHQERVESAGELVGVRAGAGGVQHDGDSLLVNHLGLVGESGL
ncbi:hypothetical protein CaCOL14_008719 [Colletotrichum acutatum]